MTFRFHICATFSLLIFSKTTAQQASAFQYPNTRVENVTDTYFGKTIVDPYRWLEDTNSPETKAWVESQNNFSEEYLKKNTLSNVAKDRISRYRASVGRSISNRHGKYYFHLENKYGSYASTLCYQEQEDGISVPFVDPAKYGKLQAIAGYELSKDNYNLAFALSESGSDWREIRIKKMKSGVDYPEVLTGVKFSNIAWRGDGFYYSRYPLPEESKMLTEKNISSRIFYHKLGDDQKDDQLIYSELNPYSRPAAETTSDERFLIIESSEIRVGKSFSKLSYIDFTVENFTTPKIFLMVPAAAFGVIDNVSDSLFLVSNYKAPRKCIFTCNPKKANKLHLVVPEFEEPLDHVSIMNNKLVCLYRLVSNYVSIVYSLKGDVLDRIDFPVGCVVSGFRGEKDATSTIYGYNSYTFPSLRYKYDLNTFKSSLISEVTLNYDYTRYITKLVFYQSKDGTKIPAYIVHKKGIKLNSDNPCLIYGYGGFGIPASPFYNPANMYFFDKGGLFVHPCIRGGGDYGDDWHKQGSHLNKQNSFDDFIAAAEYLISEKYTRPEKIAIMGGSNGGLLVGAVMTQRPELFKAVIAQVGVYDMLRFQHYTIGNAWASEYGVSSDSVQFNSLIKYSPLHNVHNVNYPATLIITGDTDDRVAPLHSYKFAAMLQKMNKGPNPILLLTNENAGHSGPATSKDYWQQQAYTYAFILNALGEQ